MEGEDDEGGNDDQEEDPLDDRPDESIDPDRPPDLSRDFVQDVEALSERAFQERPHVESLTAVRAVSLLSELRPRVRRFPVDYLHDFTSSQLDLAPSV
jgi:hypothetical protein